MIYDVEIGYTNTPLYELKQTSEKSSWTISCGVHICATRCVNQLNDENRCAIIMEHKSRNFDGTIIGSWVEMTTRMFRWRCCLMMVSRDSVSLKSPLFRYCIWRISQPWEFQNIGMSELCVPHQELSTIVERLIIHSRAYYAYPQVSQNLSHASRRKDPVSGQRSHMPNWHP